MLKRVSQERAKQGKPFASKLMPRAMLELISLIESQVERIKAYEPIINAALEVKEDHERIGQIDEAVSALPVELWP